MTLHKIFPLRALTNSFFILILSIGVFSLLLSPPVFSEEQTGKIEKEVNELLGQLHENGKGLQAERQLYDMGPEVDEVLLGLLKGKNILDSDRAFVVIEILIARGCGNAVFETLKAQLRHNDFDVRTMSASLITLIYKYAAIQELAAIVSDRKSVKNLDQKAIYESTFSTDEIIEQILEMLDSDNREERDFVVAYLKNLDFDCPSCGDSKRKWQAYFNDIATKDSKNIEILGSSDWFTAGHEEMDVDNPKDITGLTSSPDGKKIAFVSAIKSHGKYDSNLWVMDTTTNKITKIQIPGTCYDPSWSPKDDRILLQNITERGFNICTIKEDGTEFNVWTKSLGTINQNGQWSPDGSKIGFVKNTLMSRVYYELWVVDLERNTSSRIVKGSSCNLLASRIYPSWFISKKNKVVYWDCEGDERGTVGLYAASIENPGEGESFIPLDLAKDYNDSMYPSPNEDRLAYGWSYNNLAVYDFNMHKVNEYGLCGIISYMWTPTGKNILYNLQKPEDIYMLNLQTGASTILAEGYFWGKAFGPGGSSVYYLKDDKQTNLPSIRRINLDGTSDTKIFPVEGMQFATVHPTPVLKWAEKD